MLVLGLFVGCFVIILFVFRGNDYFSSFYDDGCFRSWFTSFECGFSGVSWMEKGVGLGCAYLLVLFVVFDLEVSVLFNGVYCMSSYYGGKFYCVLLFIIVLGYWLEVVNVYVFRVFMLLVFASVMLLLQ